MSELSELGEWSELSELNELSELSGLSELYIPILVRANSNTATINNILILPIHTVYNVKEIYQINTTNSLD